MEEIRNVQDHNGYIEIVMIGDKVVDVYEEDHLRGSRQFLKGLLKALRLSGAACDLRQLRAPCPSEQSEAGRQAQELDDYLLALARLRRDWHNKLSLEEWEGTHNFPEQVMPAGIMQIIRSLEA